MITEKKGQPYIKGSFVGLFKQINKKHTGNYVFSDIHWSYLRIEQCEKLTTFDAYQQKTGDYWFKEKIYANLKQNLLREKTNVFIPLGTDGVYGGNLKNVLIKNLKINLEKSYFLHKDWHEATGDIFFQLDIPEEKPKVVPPMPNKVSGVNVISNPIAKDSNEVLVQPRENSRIGSIIHVGANVLGATADSQLSTFLPNSIKASNWSKWIGVLLGMIIYALIGYFLWKHARTIFIIYFIIILFSLFGSVSKRYGFLRLLGVLAVLGFMGYYLYANYRGLIPGTVDPLKTRNGQVKIHPPKSLGDKEALDKEIEWYDFVNHFYSARYSTTISTFEGSVDEHYNLSRSINNARSPEEFLTRFYLGLHRMDEAKIDSIVDIFRDSAQQKELDVLQTAEMVVTFIQEIPYYLVHDQSCSKSVTEGNEFIRQYHRAGKPCLPNIPGGVQSPYEFLHNLKGDCDTRSLLAHAILTKLQISSSVWVSEVYGHSILGVAVPTVSGMYKEVNGIKYYGVELTAKGFRIGMVSPEHARPNNWNITVYN